MDQSNAKVHMETKECIEVKIGRRDADFQAKQQEDMLLYVAVRLLSWSNGLESLSDKDVQGYTWGIFCLSTPNLYLRLVASKCKKMDSPDNACTDIV
jgi:hypothetical protein